ncbi:MAG: hypothetical protein ACK4ZJ_19705, partial [Allorhizobium sp.]
MRGLAGTEEPGPALFTLTVTDMHTRVVTDPAVRHTTAALLQRALAWDTLAGGGAAAAHGFMLARGGDMVMRIGELRGALRHYPTPLMHC